MKVWIVFLGTNYEGEHIIGIFSSKEKAEECKNLPRQLQSDQDVYVVEYDVW